MTRPVDTAPPTAAYVKIALLAGPLLFILYQALAYLRAGWAAWGWRRSPCRSWSNSARPKAVKRRRTSGWGIA